MKKLVLILVLMLVPLVGIAGASNKAVKLHEAVFHSGYILDEATGTSWYSYAHVSQYYDGTYFVDVFRQCHYNFGDCNMNDTYGCRSYHAGEDEVLLVNKNKLVLDLQPEDCDYIYPYGAIPVQVVWQANGIREYRSDYTNYRSRYEGLEGQQCFYHSSSGSFEERSADVEGIWGDSDAFGVSWIRLRTTGHYVSNCSH